MSKEKCPLTEEEIFAVLSQINPRFRVASGDMEIATAAYRKALESCIKIAEKYDDDNTRRAIRAKLAELEPQS